MLVRAPLPVRPKRRPAGSGNRPDYSTTRDLSGFEHERRAEAAVAVQLRRELQQTSQQANQSNQVLSRGGRGGRGRGRGRSPIQSTKKRQLVIGPMSLLSPPWSSHIRQIPVVWCYFG
jgi:hypothetical protein